ncbi:MAG TPA: SRPBCC family protein [Kofleriaceae bacterium]|nr:SRPBCC family protein [Kofleriaceae bacterium]
MSQPTGAEAVGPTARELVQASPATAVVSTAISIKASAQAIWDRLLFYEQIDERPPWHLRLLLPVPIETIGKKKDVGDEARCVYEGGHLIKRVTHIDAPRRYAFEVAEQALVVGGGMRLSGGEYAIEELGGGRASLRITTRYTSPKRPRFVWRPLERAVCHSFHRHILRAMRRAIEVR